MKYKKLILEKKEYVYIKRLLNTTSFVEHFDTKFALDNFLKRIENADILDEKYMPADVIRFNTKIKILSSNNWEGEIQIVIPSEKNIKENKISILTPLAASLFGFSEGDILDFNSPIGLQKYNILSVNADLNFNKIEVII